MKAQDASRIPHGHQEVRPWPEVRDVLWERAIGLPGSIGQAHRVVDGIRKLTLRESSSEVLDSDKVLAEIRALFEKADK